jgi:ribosomal protein L1
MKSKSTFPMQKLLIWSMKLFKHNSQSQTDLLENANLVLSVLHKSDPDHQKLAYIMKSVIDSCSKSCMSKSSAYEWIRMLYAELEQEAMYKQWYKLTQKV